MSFVFHPSSDVVNLVIFDLFHSFYPENINKLYMCTANKVQPLTSHAYSL